MVVVVKNYFYAINDNGDSLMSAIFRNRLSWDSIVINVVVRLDCRASVKLDALTMNSLICQVFLDGVSAFYTVIVFKSSGNFTELPNLFRPNLDNVHPFLQML